MGFLDFFREDRSAQIRANMQKLKNAELLRVVSIDARQYDPQALKIAHEELSLRGLPVPNEENYLIKGWLTAKLSIKEAESKNMVQNANLGLDPLPFGYCNKEWKKLLELMEDGDELWEYCSPRESWGNLCGRAGIALVRNGVVLSSLLTLIN